MTQGLKQGLERKIVDPLGFLLAVVTEIGADIHSGHEDCMLLKLGGKPIANVYKDVVEIDRKVSPEVIGKIKQLAINYHLVLYIS